MGDQLNIAKDEHASTHYCQCRSLPGTTYYFSISEAGNSLFVFLGGSVKRFVEESPVELVKHCMAARAMSRFYMAARSRKYEGCIDLNRSTRKYEDSLFSIAKVMYTVHSVKTPWELGVNVGLLLDNMAVAEAKSLKIGGGRNKKM